MEQSDLERVEQQIAELDLIRRAGALLKELLRIVRSAAYEDVDRQMAEMLDCTLPEARMIRHLPLDRLSPSKIEKISAELEGLRQGYSVQGD